MTVDPFTVFGHCVKNNFQTISPAADDDVRMDMDAFLFADPFKPFCKGSLALAFCSDEYPFPLRDSSTNNSPSA